VGPGSYVRLTTVIVEDPSPMYKVVCDRAHHPVQGHLVAHVTHRSLARASHKVPQCSGGTKLEMEKQAAQCGDGGTRDGNGLS
jgi:hypothetical protein